MQCYCRTRYGDFRRDERRPTFARLLALQPVTDARAVDIRSDRRRAIQDLIAERLRRRCLVSPPLSRAASRSSDFLDRETAKIDALIGKQEQLIATLREDRTATITHAVTKGLDPMSS